MARLKCPGVYNISTTFVGPVNFTTVFTITVVGTQVAMVPSSFPGRRKIEILTLLNCPESVFVVSSLFQFSKTVLYLLVSVSEHRV